MVAGMEHANHLVDIVNNQGKVVGQKRRRDIDKATDLYHSVLTLLITPKGEVILSTIPEREDLPNRYVGRLGAPVATIRRNEETADQAAIRSLSRELFIDEPEVYHLGDRLHTYEDGHQTYVSAYYLITLPLQTYSKTDITEMVALQSGEFQSQLELNPERFAPTLRELWKAYHHELPL